MLTSLLVPSLAPLRTALAYHGLPAREGFDELIHASRDCEVRLGLTYQRNGQVVRCSVSVEEARPLTSGLEIFNEMSLEGYPVVGFGAGRGRVTFDFSWVHPDGADWRISGQRVEGLMHRVVGTLCERPRKARAISRSKRAASYSELVPAVFGRAATAA